MLQVLEPCHLGQVGCVCRIGHRTTQGCAYRGCNTLHQHTGSTHDMKHVGTALLQPCHWPWCLLDVGREGRLQAQHLAVVLLHIQQLYLQPAAVAAAAAGWRLRRTGCCCCGAALPVLKPASARHQVSGGAGSLV